MTVPQAVRNLCRERDEDRCVVCGGPAEHLHHRRPSAMGGSKRPDTNRPPNLVRVCNVDHHLIHVVDPERARENGWLLWQHESPEARPLLYRGSLRRLTDDGGVELVA